MIEKRERHNRDQIHIVESVHLSKGGEKIELKNTSK